MGTQRDGCRGTRTGFRFARRGPAWTSADAIIGINAMSLTRRPKSLLPADSPQSFFRRRDSLRDATFDLASAFCRRGSGHATTKPCAKGSRSSMKIVFRPVMRAQPPIDGMIAGLLPTASRARPALEQRADDGFVHEVVADLQPALGVELRHARRGAGAAGRAVDRLVAVEDGVARMGLRMHVGAPVHSMCESRLMPGSPDARSCISR
jgi:hypothetical protein